MRQTMRLKRMEAFEIEQGFDQAAGGGINTFGALTLTNTTVGNTNGALYSAGLFSGGDRAVANGDTLNVSYTASL